MQEVVIRDIKDIPCDLYNEQGEHIGAITTELQLYDVRLQIKEKALTGYYIIFQNKRILINKDGSIDYWPDGFFDKLQNKLDKLLFGI